MSDSRLVVFSTCVALGLLASDLPPASAQAVPFVRGDANADGAIDLTDGIYLLNFLFGGGPAPPCLDAADVNDDGGGALTIVDPIYLFEFLFAGGRPAPLPGSGGPRYDATHCGEDPTPDDLGCALFPPCPRAPPGITRIVSTSPRHGDVGVAVTRETVLHFSGRLDPDTVDSESFAARFGGGALAARVHLSPDRQTVTLFYAEPLPASALVRVTVNGDRLLDDAGRSVDADGDGRAGGVFNLDFGTLTLTTLEDTAVFGRVFASRLADVPGGESVNEPLAGVTITVDGMEETVRAVSDAMGNFRLEPAPAGRFFVHIDGREAQNGRPEGAYYPFVGKAWESVPGRETDVGNVYLPLIPAGTLQPVSETRDTQITFPREVLEQNPELQGVSITVPAGSLFADDGTRGGLVGIAPVAPDRLPGELPPGLEFALVITVQTNGANNFDRPVPACFPNLPHPVTGTTLPPSSKSALWSFNHDTGRFEIVGPMTVSSDGALVCTDPGVGIPAPGWHGTQPGCGGDAPPGPPAPPERKCSDSPRDNNAARARCVAGGGLGAAADCVLKSTACKVGCQLSPGGFATRALCKEACKQLEANCQKALDDAKECKEFYDNCLLNPGGAGRGAGVDGLEEEFLQLFDDLLADIEAQRALEDQVTLAIDGVTREDDLTPAQRAEIETLEEQLDALLEGKTFADFYGPRIDRLSELAGVLDARLGIFSSEPAYYSLEDASGGLAQRGRTEAGGAMTGVILRAETPYTLRRLSSATLTYSEVTFRTPGAGQRVSIPRAGWTPDGSADADADGLSELAELVIGTSPENADSDGDGLGDGAEVLQGLDPLDGLPARTGIIASADTPGTATDICAVNDIAVVADGERGVSVFNVFSGMNPTIIAQVDTPGSAERVSCSGSLVAVADGTRGLAVVDIRDPPAARILHQLDLGASVDAVTTGGFLGYAGLSSGDVVALDLESGEELERVAAGGAIHDLALDGDLLIVATGSELRLYAAVPGFPELLGSSSALSFFAEGITRRRRLFAGDDYVYVTSYPGYDVFDVRDPLLPRRVGRAIDDGPNSFKQIVANGSGLGVAAVGVNPRDDGTHDVSIYDLSDPTRTNRFLASFRTSGLARAVSIYNGLAYAADGDRGLQVINFLPYDTQGAPPTLALAGSGGLDLEAGIAEEGKLVRVRASVGDDVQVRSVSLHLDGRRVATDGNFPFELRFVTPRLSEQQDFRLRAQAVDTGGNATSSEEIAITLVPDATPPRVVAVAPAAGSLSEDATLVAAFFSEPMDPRSVSAATFLLTGAGGDGRFGTADDVPVAPLGVELRQDVLGAFFRTPGRLPGARYRAEITTSARDLAGNQLEAPFAWEFAAFRVVDTTVQGVVELEDGTPVEGAIVRSGAAAATTRSDARGFFSLDLQVPDNRALSVFAAAVIDGESLAGISAGLTVVADGIVDAGVIVLKGDLGGDWIARAPLPTARGALAAVTLPDGIHVLGGNHSWGGSLQLPVHEVYDPASDTWTSRAPLPDVNVWDPGAAVVNGRIYLIGGWSSGARLTREYDPQTDAWTYLAPIPVEYRYGHATAVIGDEIYVIGGTCGPCVQVFRPDRNLWRQAAPIPRNRNGLSAGAIAGKIYVVGTGAELQIYDPQTDSWTAGPPLPVPAHASSAAVFHEKLYVFGGSSNDPPAGGDLKAVQLYDPVLEEWRRLPDMPTSRSWSAAAAYEASIHVFGGFNTLNSRIDAHEEMR